MQSVQRRGQQILAWWALGSRHELATGAPGGAQEEMEKEGVWDFNRCQRALHPMPPAPGQPRCNNTPFQGCCG